MQESQVYESNKMGQGLLTWSVNLILEGITEGKTLKSTIASVVCESWDQGVKEGWDRRNLKITRDAKRDARLARKSLRESKPL